MAGLRAADLGARRRIAALARTDAVAASASRTATLITRMRIWNGVFGSFAEAGNGDVFAGDIWLMKMRQRGEAALIRSAGRGAIAPIAETCCSWLPAVAALAEPRGDALRVLDFGGGIGETYFSLAGMLPVGRRLDFVIVERSGVCRLGRDLLENEAGVTFRPDVPQRERFDVVYCASVLHYIEDWTGLLGRLIATEAEYLLFVDLPAADNEPFVSAQNYYGERIPVHFWNLHAFVAEVEARGYRLMLKARYRTPPTEAVRTPSVEDFPPQYRLDYFAQLLFRRGAPAGVR
ncbi:MAG: methyltransferase, TIGR04325 family [Proteobacteria bacterium]|nr:methyltransferase, TIGR04325 family [Pseudomonadota bacterium]